jgi:hypothetical protein
MIWNRIICENANEIRARQVVMIHSIMLTMITEHCARLWGQAHEGWECGWRWEKDDEETGIPVGIWRRNAGRGM